MGAVNDAYVLPAILLDNPGITREELVELLDQIRVGMMTPHVDFTELETDSADKYHHGLYGLAELLNLKSTDDFGFMSCKKKHRRIPKDYRPSDNPYNYFRHYASFNGQFWADEGFEVVKHIGSEIFEPETKKDRLYSEKDPKVGDFRSTGLGTYFIISGVRDLKVLGPNHFEAMFTTQKVEPRVTRESYATIDELTEDYPGLHYDEYFDWSASEGTFHEWQIESGARWQRKGGRFYLDNSKQNETQYSSTAITAEAIRLKAWNLLGFRSYDYTQKFLVENPGAMQRHTGAILTYRVNRSDYRNTEGIMPLSDMIRAKLLIDAGRRDIILTDQQALTMVLEEALNSGHGVLHDLWDERARRRMIEKDENELPF